MEETYKKILEEDSKPKSEYKYIRGGILKVLINLPSQPNTTEEQKLVTTIQEALNLVEIIMREHSGKSN
jgi:hypothetical protein